MAETIFSKIIDRSIPAEIIFEDDDVLAFNDISPQAPVHFLVIPKKPIATINDIAEADQSLVGKLFTAAATIAKSRGFAEQGYRTVMNCNEYGGQTVYHIHLHVLAGKPMGWPLCNEHIRSKCYRWTAY